MCEQLLANPLIESYEMEIEQRASSRIGVITYPGSQDDRDALWALAALGAEADARSGTRRATSPVSTPSSCRAASRTATTSAAARSRASPRRRRRCAIRGGGRLVLGICNGFQILCEAGLLPGALLRERVAALRLPRRAASRRAERPAVHVALRRPAASRHPGQARRRPLRPAAGSRPGAGRAPLPRQPERIRRRRSPASATRRATSWDSCRTRSTPSTRSSAPTTARSSSRRSSTPRATARSRA